MRLIVGLTSLWLFATFVPMAQAAPVIQTENRLEVNWSTMKVRFYGESKAKVNNDESYNRVVKDAWRDGLRYASDAARDLHVSVYSQSIDNLERLTAEAKTAGENVATSTYSYNTTYFGDGTVRVHLENQLPKILWSSAIRFRQKEVLDTGMSPFTGLVFELDRAVQPKAVYEVVDQKGEVLFHAGDMAAQAFRENLMGRWYSRPNQTELVGAVGKRPRIIQAKVAENGQFVVDESTWKEATSGHRSLLVNGKIAISLP